jgi:hypothetical protein
VTLPTTRIAAAAICLLAFGLTASRASAASYELTVYSDEISAPGELEFESLASLARPRAGTGLPGHVWQALGEINYGVAKGWELGLELPAVYATGRHKIEGLALEAQYVAPHDKTHGWFWGVRSDIGRVASLYEDDTALSLEVDPIVGYRGAGYRFVFNPSLERPLRGTETTTRFQPSAKFALRASGDDELGAEYYGDWGNVRKLLPSARRDETLYLVWDRRTPFGHFNMGLGQALRPTAGSADRWVAKVGLQFDTD